MSKDYKPETLDLIRSLLSAGFKIERGNNGGEEDEDFKYITEQQFLEEITAAEDATITVITPDICRTRWIYIVFGNEPGYLVCDYHCDPLLDKTLEEFSVRWENQPQPITVS